MMEWLKEKGCHCDEWTFAHAARLGNLEGMIWLKLNGCPWYTNMLAFAANYGNIEYMDWLKNNGCPMTNSFYAPKCLKDENVVQ